MSRTLALVFAALAPVVLALTWRWSNATPPPSRPDLADETKSKETSPTAVELKTERIEVAKERDSAQPPIPDDAIWLDLRVIDAGTKAPVPGALVRWSTNEAWQQARELPPREVERFIGNDEHLAERFGWQTHSGADGIARIAASKWGATVHGYADGRYATRHVTGEQPPPGGWSLELEADRSLRAQVLEPDGRPAIDVEVGILAFDPEGSRLRDYGRIRHVATTAPEGMAEFRHIQDWPSDLNGRPTASLTFRVAALVPGQDDPGVPFDFLAPPASPIELRLPPTGKLRARLLHAGQPLTTDVAFQAWQGPDENFAKENVARRVLVDDDGWARFTRVGLGKTLSVVARLGGGAIRGEVAGPIAAGQEISFDLDADRIFSLSGTLLGSDAVPLAKGTVVASLDAAPIVSGSMTVETDARGRFLLLLGDCDVDKSTLSRFVLSRNLMSEPSILVSVPPRRIVRGVNDLGVLQLSPGPLLVAGRVIFDPPREMPVPFRIEQLTAAGDGAGEDVWEPVEGYAAETRNDGSFELRGEVRPARHRLVFLADRHLPIAPLEFRDGADDLVVHLDAGHRLNARVLVPEATSGSCVYAVLVPHDPVPPESPARDHSSSDRYTANGWSDERASVKLGWPSLPDGRYRLEIRAPAMPKPLALIDDIVLPPPEGGDPRLQAIDLRSRTRLVYFVGTRAGASDAKRQNLVLFFLPQDDDKGWRGTTLPADGGVLLVVKDQAEVMVASPDFQPARLDCSGDQVRIALARWPSADISIANLPPLPEGVTLRLTLTRVHSPGRKEIRYDSRYRSGKLSELTEAGDSSTDLENGHARPTIDDGTYRIGGYLLSRSGRYSRMLSNWTPAEITGSGSLAPITVQISIEELQTELSAFQVDGK